MKKLGYLLIGVGALAMLECMQTNAPVGARPVYAPPAGAPAATAHAQPPGVTTVVDEQGRSFQIAQGTPGDPSVIGCSDGQREAFVDAAAFPTIAGCIAEWSDKQSLRRAGSGTACGDDAQPCAAPADACGPGWHMCGSSGAVSDLLRVTPQQCEHAGGGRFVAAISHCKAQDGCTYGDPKTATYACFASGWCSEPVCCGNDCGEFGVCRDGVWPNMTHIPVGTDQGCGAIGSSRARGVLCCK